MAHETNEDLLALGRLLEQSYATAGKHLRSIFTTDHRTSASDLSLGLSGVFPISLATVSARCEPLVAPVDGLFYRGRLWFGLPPGSQRARHLHARPQVSATYINGDSCMIVHGVAEEVASGHPLFDGWDRYVRDAYGLVIDLAAKSYETRREPGFNGFISARRMYAQGFPRA